MHRAPVGQAAGEGLNGVPGEAQHPVPNAGRGGPGRHLARGLGHGQGDFVRVKAHHGAIAADDLKPQYGLATGLGKGLEGQAEGAGGADFGLETGAAAMPEGGRDGPVGRWNWLAA